VLAIAVIIGGAFITSTEVVGRVTHSAVSPDVDATLHRALAISLTLLTMALASWITFTPAHRWLRAVAWAGVATLILSAVLGWSSPPRSASAAVGHALLSHLFLSLVVAIAVGTSTAWNRTPEVVDGSGKPMLRPLALATPLIVFLQIALGAAYRHDMTGIMPHMAVAMGVAFLALIGSSVVLQNFARPASMRRAAAVLISLVLTQVFLGIGAFLMLLMNVAGTVYFIAITIGHVLVGASTLAASVAMAMQVCRSVQPKVTSDAVSNPA